MSEPIIHAWWTLTDEYAKTACGLTWRSGPHEFTATWKRADTTCPECLRTLAAAGVTT